jgi:hypothetical protein
MGKRTILWADAQEKQNASCEASCWGARWDLYGSYPSASTTRFTSENVRQV